MNKTHKRELKKIPKRIKLKKEPTIIHPTDTYTITPVKYEKKKKVPKISNAAWPTLGTQISNKKKACGKRKKRFSRARRTRGANDRLRHAPSF